MERISLTVMNGRLWFHVCVGRRHVASIPIAPREIAELPGIGAQVLELAEAQDEAYARELASQDGAFGWGGEPAGSAPESRSWRSAGRAVSSSSP